MGLRAQRNGSYPRYRNEHGVGIEAWSCGCVVYMTPGERTSSYCIGHGGGRMKSGGQSVSSWPTFEEAVRQQKTAAEEPRLVVCCSCGHGRYEQLPLDAGTSEAPCQEDGCGETSGIVVQSHLEHKRRGVKRTTDMWDVRAVYNLIERWAERGELVLACSLDRWAEERAEELARLAGDDGVAGGLWRAKKEAAAALAEMARKGAQVELLYNGRTALPQNTIMRYAAERLLEQDLVSLRAFLRTAAIGEWRSSRCYEHGSNAGEPVMTVVRRISA